MTGIDNTVLLSTFFPKRLHTDKFIYKFIYLWDTSNKPIQGLNQFLFTPPLILSLSLPLCLIRTNLTYDNYFEHSDLSYRVQLSLQTRTVFNH